MAERPQPEAAGTARLAALPSPSRRPPRPNPVVGVALVLGGIVAVAIALGVLTRVTAEIRVILSLVGLGAAYSGLGLLAKARYGPSTTIGTKLAAVWVTLVVGGAVVADFLPLKEAEDASKTFLEPIRATPDLFSRHPLGTDDQGLDILGGLLYGSRVSLVVGIGAVAIGVIVGGLLGVMSAYFRGAFDRAVNILVTSALAFPPLVLLLAVAAVLPRNTRNIALALALLTIPSYVRLARANALVLAQKEFVLAARAAGASNGRIILRELVPGVVAPLLSFAFIAVSIVIVAEASLSFLGLSIPRPKPTLGNMIATGQNRFETIPHLVFIPATFLFLVVLSLNRLGEEARRRFDPKDSKL